MTGTDTVRYEIVDVFTDRAFAGNPLAVVHGGGSLTGEQMQLLAREFNLSETTVVLPASAAQVDYDVRIFTPQVELPFAGHPSVGTAWVLAAAGIVGRGRVVQRCGAGDLPLHVADGPDGRPGRVTLTGGDPTVGPPLDAADSARLAAALGLEPADVVVPPRQAGTGLSWTHLGVRADAVARAAADVAAIRAVRDLAPAGVYVYAWDDRRATAHARGFAPDLGVAEDPATGSAALGLGAHLVAAGALAGDGTTAYVVHQGVEMGRPSRLHGEVEAAGGTARACRVAGDVVPVASGTIRVPPA